MNTLSNIFIFLTSAWCVIVLLWVVVLLLTLIASTTNILPDKIANFFNARLGLISQANVIVGIITCVFFLICLGIIFI